MLFQSIEDFSVFQPRPLAWKTRGTITGQLKEKNVSALSKGCIQQNVTNETKENEEKGISLIILTWKHMVHEALQSIFMVKNETTSCILAKEVHVRDEDTILSESPQASRQSSHVSEIQVTNIPTAAWWIKNNHVSDQIKFSSSREQKLDGSKKKTNLIRPLFSSP